MGEDDGVDLEGFSLHWTRHSIKAIGCYTDKHGPIDFDLPTLTEGYYDGAKVHSPWYDREVERRSDDPASIAQELDIAYLSSGYPVFKPEWSRRHLETATEPVVRQRPIVHYEGPCPSVMYENRVDGEFWWYENNGFMPLAEKDKNTISTVYCCGVDTAEGLGNKDSDPDYSAIVIWNPVTHRPAGVFRSRMVRPADVAAILADLAKRRDLLIIIERNGPGLAVIATLAGWLTGYHQDAQVFYPIKYPDFGGRTEKQPGFRTTAESKHTLIELIRSHTDPDCGTLLDRRLIEEYTVYANLTGQKMGAPSGMHDDLVMALGLSLVATRTAQDYRRPSTREEEDDVLMARLAKANADGSLTDAQVFEQLGL